MNPKFDILSFLVFLLIMSSLPLCGQSFIDSDEKKKECFITRISLQGDDNKQGLVVEFPEILLDAFSDFDGGDIELYLGDKEIVSGNFISCGTHIIQARKTTSRQEMTNCYFTLTINSSDHEEKNIEKELFTVKEKRVGDLSAFWESGGRGPGIISSNNGDPGGKSYGTYQISSRHGYLENFLDNEGICYRALFEGYEVMSPGFDSIWRMIADCEPEVFEQRQNDFIDRTHYQVFSKRLKKQLGLDINDYSQTIKEVVWSTVVQHGPYNSVFNFALAGLDLNIISEKTIIELVYKERGLITDEQLFYYPRINSDWKKFLIQRFHKEKDFAISRLK